MLFKNPFQHSNHHGLQRQKTKNLNITSAKSLIPHQLFNWIAWKSGLSDTPHAETYVKVSRAKKILSIAQDIVYLHAKGKVAAPKHHALAMTVRHLTGSSRLINVLNGLGHSI